LLEVSLIPLIARGTNISIRLVSEPYHMVPATSKRAKTKNKNKK
jgi:hypothetical protein